MPHVTDSELIQYAAGELPQPQRARIDEHVAGCRACRDRQRQTAQTWELLGNWQVEPLATDLAEAVMAGARRGPEPGITQPASWRRASMLLRAAAAIAVAAGLGHLAARWTVPSSPGFDEGGVARLAQSTGVDSASLGVLELGSATGWEGLMFDDVVPSEREGS